MLLTSIFYTLMIFHDGSTEPIKIKCTYDKGVRICKVVHTNSRICLPIIPIEDENAPDVFCQVRNGKAIYFAN